MEVDGRSAEREVAVDASEFVSAFGTGLKVADDHR
jgi:hypothetical protein